MDIQWSIWCSNLHPSRALSHLILRLVDIQYTLHMQRTVYSFLQKSTYEYCLSYGIQPCLATSTKFIYDQWTGKMYVRFLQSTPMHFFIFL